jgi:hypothetical protein
MAAKYYFFYLELALKDPDDSHIYAFENLSHIPTSKLVEIFDIDLQKDPHIREGYFLTKTNFQKHKEYIKKHFGAINLDKFEYCLRLYCSDDLNAIQELYKVNYLE